MVGRGMASAPSWATTWLGGKGRLGLGARGPVGVSSRAGPVGHVGQKEEKKGRGEQGRPGLDRKGGKRILAQGRRRKISFLWITEFGIRFKGFLKRGLRGEFWEEFKRIQRSLRRTPMERLRRDSLRL